MLSRRQFLQQGLAVVSLGATMPSVFAKAVISGLAEPRWRASAQTQTLVVVQMAGGNDGLNTVVPYKDGHYYDARPGLRQDQSKLIPLDDHAALNPNLAPLKELWDL